MTSEMWLGGLALAMMVGCGGDKVSTQDPVDHEKPALAEAETPAVLGPAALQCGCDHGFSPELDPHSRPVDVELDEISACGGDKSCQLCFDCFGWQLFVALNWPAGAHGEPDVGKPFGAPGDRSPVVWETFVDARKMFATAQTPEWNDRQIEKVIHPNLRGKLQADHYWLTDQSGNLVSYEIRINRSLYDYIRDEKIVTKAGLLELYSSGEGLKLPAGKVGGEGGDEQGTVEIKAAWRLVPAGEEAYFEANYKVSEATVVGDDGKSSQTHLVALVGLHIAKKTPKLHQWAWATFEHVDNVPRPGTEPDPDTRYNFFDPTVDQNYEPSWKSPPDKQGKTPQSKPVQVERAEELDFGKDAQTVNEHMGALIASKFPNSVWRNYRLVNVQWPKKPSKLDAKLTLPAADGDPAPKIVANITMETYMQQKDSGGGAGFGIRGRTTGKVPKKDQGKSSCIGCHRLAAITPSFADSKLSWYTDLSTIFYQAK